MANALPNTPGLGIEYEVHVPAYFALLLNNNPEIEDFTLRSNVPGFETLDDLLIEIKTKGGGTLYFGLQLKHKQDPKKKLLPTDFEAENKYGKKGPYNLEKYCEAFKKLNEDNRKKYHFILYTNNNFDSSCTSEVKNFCMQATQDVCCFGKNFFDTSAGDNNLYKFEVEEETKGGKNVNCKKDYKDFFSKFSLYTGQANTRGLTKCILDILKYKECYATYIDFFRSWHRDDFIDKCLDKKTLNVHLVDVLLSSVAINNYYLSDGQDGNSNFFEKLVQQFDITIVNASKEEFTSQLEENVNKYPEEFIKEENIIQLAKDSKFIDQFSNELTEETKMKLLRYFHQKPLILDFNTNSKNQIYEASKLCRLQETGIKLVIVGKDKIVMSKFSHLKLFRNLKEIDENFLEETKMRCKLSLQGRNISLENIFEDELRELITPREIFQMLKGSFSIGEEKEKMPECYIPRTVSAKVFDIETIIKHSSRSAALVFYYEDNKFEELKILIQNVIDPEDYLYEDCPGAIILRNKKCSTKRSHEGNTKDTLPEVPTIILRKEECSSKQLNKIHEESGKKDFHLFRVIDGKRCLLLMSTKDISYNENYKFTKISIEEKKIHFFFNKSINILCAQPGMGKSILIKYLKNECDSNFWTVRVDLKAHNNFLKKNYDIEVVLNYFLELENCEDKFLLKFKKMFLEKRKIVFFLDGLDEVDNESVDCVLNITTQLSEMGFRIWLSSRQNLQQKVEQKFNIFSIEIEEIDENQQKKYIIERLKSEYDINAIEEIVKKIFNNTDLANNCQILEIPLQLHIITEIFLDEGSYHNNLIKEDSFILTKMFDIFFKGKYKHFETKIKAESLHLLKNLKKLFEEKYELVALHSVLDDKDFQKLQEVENFKLPSIESEDIRLGIITEINSENKAVFEHLTFAEYFASKFLVKNFDKARILKEEIFSEKYQNLLLIYNIMLAEDSPLHLAIIYNDLSRFQEMYHESSVVDKGGRNLLQVAACVATRHPLLKSYIDPFFSECVFEDLPVKHFKGENSTMKEIINLALSNGEPFKNDKIFEWNSLHYALATGALYVMEAVLEKCEKPHNFYEMLVKYYSAEVVAYYSFRFGYHRLLSEILAKKLCDVTRIVTTPIFRRYDYNYLVIENNSILNFIFTSGCTNKIKIVELLTHDDANKIVYDKDKYTLFHFAVLHKDTELIQFLLGKGADVNFQNKNGWSPLYLAAGQNNFELSKLLVENGADVNFQNKNEWSPLHLAVKQNNFELSKLLVENEADVNIKDYYGWSPLYWAAAQNNFELSKLLVENGADVNIKNDYEWSLLNWAALDNIELSKLLVENGSDFSSLGIEGWSPLHWAAQINSFELLKLLVENGADVNIKSKDGRSPLHLAVLKNNFKLSKFLIEKGVDVNAKDRYGKSPLFYAVKQTKNPEISKVLFKNGAEVNSEIWDAFDSLLPSEK